MMQLFIYGIRNMKYRRYGKMRLKNHVSNCLFDMFFSIFGFAGIIIDNFEICYVIFIGFAIIDKGF